MADKLSQVLLYACVVKKREEFDFPAQVPKCLMLLWMQIKTMVAFKQEGVDIE